MSPSPRAAWALVAIALLALVVPPLVASLLAVAVLTASVIDAFTGRSAPALDARFPRILSRSVPEDYTITAQPPGATSVHLRQARVPDVELRPQGGETSVTGKITGQRRGRHRLPPVGMRVDGPLRLGRWFHRGAGNTEVLVYPNLHAARRIALAVRKGRFGDPGKLTRGPLGLGTDFESIREYLPDDDIRQVNWRATARMERPMSNQYRVERDRDVICVVDCGRLMASPVGGGTRLDAALDAAVAVALVADVVGDRAGAIAFDSVIRRDIKARRAGGDRVVHGLFDLEPTTTDSDYELAFRSVAGGKRSLVIVLTDLLDVAAARTLLDAVPLLSRRHMVIVASVLDTDLQEATAREPRTTHDVYAAAVALDVFSSKANVAAHLRRSGADVIEAAPASLGAACVRGYLRAKSRGRL
ncbi:MAG TPA: DUF58 domain-containing protein [Actinomycetota bacterium]|nr:DUF58 domain-containing protein [Actinomycetota bacterium]